MPLARAIPIIVVGALLAGPAVHSQNPVPLAERFRQRGNGLYLSDGAWDTSRDVSAKMGIQNELAYNRQPSFGDVNRDGWQDVVVLDRSESLNQEARAVLFMNRGNGTFEPKPTTMSGLDGAGICGEAADLDGDGLLDLVFAADPDNTGPALSMARYESKVYWNTGLHGASREPLATANAYDPSRLPSGQLPTPLDLMVTDAGRRRDVPILVYLPADTSAAPVVLFSHGLGGSRQGSAYLGRHWAARGYVVVFLQHPGSDDGVWKNRPLAEINRAMRDAASRANLLLRVRDVPAVLDQLARWQGAANHPLAGRLDLSRVGMSGHSFGAVTTQAVSGQTAPGGGQPFTDPRIKAAVVFSPSEPATASPAEAFGRVTIPWLLVTGTRDVARLGGSTIGASDVEKRLSVFPALPPGSKYELVLHDAEHSAFSDRALPGDSVRRNPNHHRVILALSTAFWDAYLKADAAARAWLDGAGPRAVLETNDRWQTK
jgi:predicted dienelactone hydrolase